jgi:cyclophilin family peptidyl-prolyl cis-trans isomerase
MSDRASSGADRRGSRKSPRVRCRPELESLEGRQLLNAALAPPPNITVPQYFGYQVPLDGSASGASTQTYTVTSSNPDIKATIAQGQFLTMNVSHASSGAGDPAFSGTIVFQLFNDLTPTTATKIEGFVNSGFYNNKNIFRVASGFPDANGFAEQGGSPNNLSSGVSGLPGTPFANEIVQQLAFAPPGQLAMANTGQPNSNDTQFFITSAAQPSNSFLMYNYTIFGQVVSGMDIVQKITQVAKTTQPGGTEVSFPISPVVVNTATLSSTNPDGVVHVDATQAQAGETSNITVTATDPATNTSKSQSFAVNVAQNTNSYSALTLQPVAFSALQVYQPNTPQTFTLQGSAANSGAALTFAITSQPAHGTLSGLNPNTGAVTYTPNAGFQGIDSFQFTVTNPTAKLTSLPKTVTLTTTAAEIPTAAAVSATSHLGNPVTIQLAGSSPISGQAINYAITKQPTKGTLSQLNTVTGSVVYTPTPGQLGPDSFQYTVTTVGPPAPGVVSQPGTVTVNLVQNPINTNAVRLIGTVLVVTPPPGDFTSNNKNTILVTETAAGVIQVFVNGQLDIIQPQVTNASGLPNVTEIEVFGGKASNAITVDPSVDPTIFVTLIGGHGKNHVNALQAGAGPTLEQAWFGRKKSLAGGTGLNDLIASKGHVKFRPTETTDQIFAGMANQFQRIGRRIPPSGTFFRKNKHGKLVPVPTPPIIPDYQDFTPGVKFRTPSPTTTTHKHHTAKKSTKSKA